MVRRCEIWQEAVRVAGLYSHGMGYSDIRHAFLAGPFGSEASSIHCFLNWLLAPQLEPLTPADHMPGTSPHRAIFYIR